MLHHTRISIGSDDVTMLRLQLFFFHTLRLRHIHVNNNWLQNLKLFIYLFDYMNHSDFTGHRIKCSQNFVAEVIMKSGLVNSCVYQVI